MEENKGLSESKNHSAVKATENCPKKTKTAAAFWYQMRPYFSHAHGRFLVSNATAF